MPPVGRFRAAALSVLSIFAGVSSAPAESYLFSYFVDNGEDGLHLAASGDGLHWRALRGGRSFLTPVVGESRLMRDPCLLLGPHGIFRMVWTTSWTGKTIGYASSTDLLHWSEQRALPVMGAEPKTINCWAPEVVYDPSRSDYLIYWSSTVPGRFSNPDERYRPDPNLPPRNHRLYATTTKDFAVFSPTRLAYDPGFNVIDETIERDGRGWLMFVKNESELPAPAKYIYLVRGKSSTGPWTRPSAPISPSGIWSEGPTALKIGSLWYVYFDEYRNHRFGLVRSKDLVHWEDLGGRLRMPAGIRHGTALRVPDAIIRRIDSSHL